MDLHETQMKKSIYQARELRDSLEQAIWVKHPMGCPYTHAHTHTHTHTNLQQITNWDILLGCQ